MEGETVKLQVNHIQKNSQAAVFHFQASLSLLLYLFVCLQFTKDVVSQLDSVKIDLRGIILLEAEGRQNLLDFSEAGLSEINYADYLEEVTHSHRNTETNTHRHV